MSKTQRTITVALWLLVVVSLLGLLAMQRWQAGRDAADAQIRRQLREGTVLELTPDGFVPATQRSVPFEFPSPAFALTDQLGGAFDSQALRGKVWAAAFFFSQCQGICPGMLGKVQRLAVATDDPDIHIAYFTVDPERDTPERLRDYADKAKADPARWHMLTGNVDEMKRIAAGFHVGYETPAQHTGKIFLVDRQGIVRGYYEQGREEEMRQLAADAKKLLAGEAIR